MRVRLVACEDTRTCRTLFSWMGAPCPELVAYHDHNAEAAAAGPGGQDPRRRGRRARDRSRHARDPGSGLPAGRGRAGGGDPRGARAGAERAHPRAGGQRTSDRSVRVPRVRAAARPRSVVDRRGRAAGDRGRVRGADAGRRHAGGDRRRRPRARRVPGAGDHQGARGVRDRNRARGGGATRGPRGSFARGVRDRRRGGGAKSPRVRGHGARRSASCVATGPAPRSRSAGWSTCWPRSTPASGTRSTGPSEEDE